ncbi:aldo/keto reductase [Amycolatopsis dongchuanensis]|uniref:NADP-dependent oxidoreductase domain-containing protein n=1 Tax=Amycolatopsis dongchuanensis TaxID=1070866 RepID=A0ABP9Q766_9PSEU
MRYRRLGECGLKISELSLGTWQTHNSHNTAGAVQVTRRAYELGVNLFDTANEYQDGAASTPRSQGPIRTRNCRATHMREIPWRDSSTEKAFR